MVREISAIGGTRVVIDSAGWMPRSNSPRDVTNGVRNGVRNVGTDGVARETAGASALHHRGIDRIGITGQNEPVRRLVLLAIGLSALMWAMNAGTRAVPPHDIFTMCGGGSCQLSGVSHTPGDSDQQWCGRHHTIAALTESVWKSAPVLVSLAAAPSARVFDATRAVSSSDPPERPAPPHLRPTPLLI